MSGDIKQQSNGIEEVDAKFKLSNLFLRNRTDMGILTTHPDSLYYNMNHRNRGYCLIINNKTFDPSTNCSPRTGTDIDFANLKNLFESLGFDIIPLQDPCLDKLFTTLEYLSKQDHTDNDCFVCCILTHGDDGVLYCKDAKYPIENVFKYFKGDKCISLAGKPKLFFIQACRGNQLDSGVKIIRHRDVADSSTIHRIPTWADFLMHYSCVPGYYSWRNTSCGSWFIQSLVAVLSQYNEQFDLLSMLTIVNKEVAYNYESNVPSSKEMHSKKMVSCITSMLTRQVLITKKEKLKAPLVAPKNDDIEMKNGKINDVEMENNSKSNDNTNNKDKPKENGKK